MRKLTGEILLSGRGLHSGKECVVKIEPYDSPEVILSAGNEEYPVRELKTDGTNRGSDYIFPSGERIRTCEHVLSGLYGMEIYGGVRVSVEGGEMPSLDGCARTLCENILLKSEITESPVRHYELTSPVTVSSPDGTRIVCAFPSDELHITYAVEYEYVGAQIYDYERSRTDYFTEIAPARTFAYEREIAYLQEHGLALGGSLDNAIVIGGTVRAKGGLHWPDEFARHKVLDLIGDLSSVGVPLRAHIVAIRAGHELHLRLAEKLKGAIRVGRD